MITDLEVIFRQQLIFVIIIVSIDMTAKDHGGLSSFFYFAYTHNI